MPEVEVIEHCKHGSGRMSSSVRLPCFDALFPPPPSSFAMLRVFEHNMTATIGVAFGLVSLITTSETKERWTDRGARSSPGSCIRGAESNGPKSQDLPWSSLVSSSPLTQLSGRLARSSRAPSHSSALPSLPPSSTEHSSTRSTASRDLFSLASLGYGCSTRSSAVTSTGCLWTCIAITATSYASVSTARKA